MFISESSEIVVVHLLLALGLFFLVNWLGKHSISIGYMNLSLFFKADDAPAFNFILRSLTPIIYLFIVSSALYAFDLDNFVTEIWLVIAYYFIFRVSFNLLLNRARLLNWQYQIFLAAITILVSYFAYDKFIQNKDTLLPDFSTMTNELWIIITLFMYATFNNMKFSTESTKKRKLSYIRHNLNLFQNKYSPIINKNILHEEIEPLVYSIMIYENFNRPPAARFLERLLFPFGKSKTLGVMQTSTEKVVSDEESVLMGVNKINSDYEEALKKHKNATLWTGSHPEGEEEKEYRIKMAALRSTARKYNPSDNYVREIMDIHHIVTTSSYLHLIRTTSPSIYVE